jgi:hypothetical protein
MADGKIFINYRRDDSRADSGRLYDRLAARFPGRVFRDVGSLEPGVEWQEAISRVLDQAAACVVVIGKSWVNIADAAGRRRLDDPRDTVRQELRAALERRMRVFPVLVGGARMPEEEELPADLQPLCRRNALEITEQDWDEGCGKLFTALETTLGVRAKSSDRKALSSRASRIVAATGSVVAMIALAFYIASYSPSAQPGGGAEASSDMVRSGPVDIGREQDSPASDRSGDVSRLSGTWKADVVERGVLFEIIWHIWPDGTSSYSASNGTQTVTANTTWTYANGVVYERSATGSPSSGSIRWIDENQFVLTIIDNGDPQTRGLERRYSRLSGGLAALRDR